jgi:hypothetical protein
VRLGVAQQGARHVLELVGPVAEVRRGGEGKGGEGELTYMYLSE